MTPKARFTMSSAVTPGSATASAPENSCEPQVTTDQRPSGPRPVVPIGSVRKPSTRISMSVRWPFRARKVSVTSMV